HDNRKNNTPTVAPPTPTHNTTTHPENRSPDPHPEYPHNRNGRRRTPVPEGRRRAAEEIPPQFGPGWSVPELLAAPPPDARVPG
ncbi:hypothetical protein, partial [Pseudonocardia sp. McavD-2-B]|uniref:hypothetical protein n=1 Tax=Pseudonocardia sp. McavD-2-B TaxID=2954499 RepID=UPI002097B68A